MTTEEANNNLNILIDPTIDNRFLDFIYQSYGKRL